MKNTNALSPAELDGQHTAELPRRELLAAITLFGLPLVGVSGVNVDVSGPNFLA